MSVLYSILLAIHVLICLLLVLLVMLQRPKQEGLGAAFASGMMNDIAGPNTTDVLQKGTRMMAIAFFILTTCLAVLKAQEHRKDDVDLPVAPAAGETETVPLNLDPNAPQEGMVPNLDIPLPVTPGTETPSLEDGAATPAPESAETPAPEGTDTPAAPEGDAEADKPKTEAEPAPEAPAEAEPKTEEAPAPATTEEPAAPEAEGDKAEEGAKPAQG